MCMPLWVSAFCKQRTSHVHHLLTVAHWEVLCRTWSTSLSIYGTLIAVGTIAALVLRVFYRYQVARMYSEHRASQRATEQAYSRDSATLASLTQDAAQLESRACAVVLAALLAHPDRECSMNQLEAHCSELLRTLEQETGLKSGHLSMNTTKSVDVLRRLGVIVVNDGGPVRLQPMLSALQSLEGVWSSLLTERR